MALRAKPARPMRTGLMLAGSLLFGLTLGAGAAHAQSAPPPARIPDGIAAYDQGAVARRGFFYVGGQYDGDGPGAVMRGQIYVEVLEPREVRHPFPLVLIHGAAQTATNWMGTPDGRQGWAEFFAAQGWLVYMIDQPARGRSSYDVAHDGRLQNYPTGTIENRFTAPERAMLWPQARLHTQWPTAASGANAGPNGGPEAGRRGDPVFDAFLATQVAGLASNADSEKLMQAAGAALLDRIGPAILMPHSQAGLYGWLIADARPQLVKGIVALEPSGPPFQDHITSENRTRAWGLTDIPLTYAPLVNDPAELSVAQEDAADGPDLVRCWMQTGTPRRLPHLSGIPIAIVVTEASYHATYDHCTAKYLHQAGVENELLRLADHGIHGNGHMLMLEKNSLDIAALLDRWMREHVR